MKLTCLIICMMLQCSMINWLRNSNKFGLWSLDLFFNSTQDDLEDENESINNFPCNAAPIAYSPPSSTTITSITGEIGSESQLRRSKSSVVRKSYTSDDELDEINYPLSSILNSGSSSPASSKPNWKWKDSRDESAVRYELLRDVWMNSEWPCTD